MQLNTVVWLHIYSQIGEFHLHVFCFSILWALSRTDLAVLKNMSYLMMTQYVWSSSCVLCIPDCLNTVFSSSYEVACYIQFWLVYSLVWVQLVVYQILSLPFYQDQNTEMWMRLRIRHSCLQKHIKKCLHWESRIQGLEIGEWEFL